MTLIVREVNNQVVVQEEGGAAMAAALAAAFQGLYRGPTEPVLPPGATGTWFKTDPVTGALLDILDVTGA